METQERLRGLHDSTLTRGDVIGAGLLVADSCPFVCSGSKLVQTETYRKGVRISGPDAALIQTATPYIS